MQAITYIPVVSLLLLSTIKNSVQVDILDESQGFCYPNSKCWKNSGPDDKYWPGTCASGGYQSPIDLSVASKSSATPSLNIVKSSYKSHNFFVGNNGHTITLRFRKDIKAAEVAETDTTQKNSYILHRAHFHWGENNSVGSEHTIGRKRFSLEMHFVHWNIKYGTFLNATKATDDPSALMVIGILFEAKDSNPDYEPLKHVIENIPELYQPEVKEIPIALDFNEIVPKSGAMFYNYKGSLTTPPCSEIVSWIVFSQPIQISSRDMEGFRKVKDVDGFPLTRNYRNTQYGNRRKTYFLKLE